MADRKRKSTGNIEDERGDSGRVHDVALARAAVAAPAPLITVAIALSSSTVVGPTPPLLTHVIRAAPSSLLQSAQSAAASSESLLSSSATAVVPSPDPLAAVVHEGPFAEIQSDMDEFYTTAHLTVLYICQSTLYSDRTAADKWIARLRKTIDEWEPIDIACAALLHQHAQHADHDSIVENRELCELACEKGRCKLAVIDARRQLPVLEAELEEATAAYEKQRLAKTVPEMQSQRGAHPLGLLRVR